MINAPKICAAICTYNRYDKLDLAIASLIHQNIDDFSFEIIIVDNTPDPLKKTDIQKKYVGHKNIRYIKESESGLSNARNIAAKETNASIIAYLDDDAIASKNWLKHIVKGFNLTKMVGVVGGRIDPIWEIKKPVWIDESIYGYVSIVNWGGDLRISAAKEWFAGANIAFKTHLVKELGFNTKLGRNGGGSNLLSNEESHLINSIKGLGYKTVYCPEASVDHLIVKERLNQQWFRKRAAWQAISDFISSNGLTNEQVDLHWDYFLSYMWECPPAERSVAGLMTHKDDPKTFKKQLDSIYDFTTALLAGFRQ